MMNSRPKQQFNEIVAIIGLPRSGTTLATSVFDAHPYSVACYEPWNRVKGADLSAELTPEDLIARFDLNPAPDANIFVVKETSVDARCIKWLAQFLQFNASTHRVQIVWSLRNYRHNYLSFVEGAREWWGHTDMDAGAEGYTRWVERARQGTLSLLTLYQKYPGAIYAYESLAEDAANTLPRLMEALGLDFYEQQVDYLEHYSPKQVRGDVSMSKNPRPISNDSMKKRETEWAKYEKELAGSDGDVLRQQLDQFWQSIQEQVALSGPVPTALMPDRLRCLILRPGHEYRELFSSKEEWDEFMVANPGITDRGIIENFAISISRNGIRFFDKAISANDIELVDGDYRNSFVHQGLASHTRAMIVELLHILLARKVNPEEVRIYAPGARSGLAIILTKHFSHVQSSECFSSPEQQQEFPDIEHQDLAALTYDDGSFNYVVIDDQFQHASNLEKVLSEAYRVLTPGGVLLASFPFDITRQEHTMMATQNSDGSINYLVEPETQQNSADEQEPVVFQIPGWDILNDCSNAGFARSRFVFLSSPTRGMLASDISGIMTLRADKPA